MFINSHMITRVFKMPDKEIIKFGFAHSYPHYPFAKNANNSAISFTKCITSQSS